MGLTLTTIPGFSDLQDSALVAGDPAFGIHVEEISANAEFAMVRCEIFESLHYNGDTIPLYVSPIDGYPYTREEQIYVFNIALSTNKDSGWIQIGSGSLWFCNWFVDQSTGQVFSLEWYRNNGSGGTRTETNDGQIKVYTVCQRQRTNLIMSATPSFSVINPADIATDKPWKQSLAQALNDNAKFAVSNKEIFYLGEFINGQQIPRGSGSALVSPIDGYQYQYSECKFHLALRWTWADTTFQQPDEDHAQLGPVVYDVDSSGNISITISTVDNDGNRRDTHEGRVAAFAFCTRSGTPGSAPLANSFAEIPETNFVPGSSLRASNVLAIKKNIDEAILTPEFFGPDTYHDGDTVALPTSPVDGYVYALAECTFVWRWHEIVGDGGSHCRMPVFYAGIDPVTRHVTMQVWRLPPGGPYVHDQDYRASMKVITVARRQQVAPAVAASNGTITSPSDVATATVGTTQMKVVPFTSTRNDFTVAHGIDGTPIAGTIALTSNGEVRFQTAKYDGANVYLHASADGIAGFVLLFYNA